MTVRTLASTSAAAGWQAYLRLCKPRVVALVVFTAMVAMLLAAPPGEVPWPLLLVATTGIALAGASAAVFNHVADREIDNLMGRTRNRPLPSGAVSVGSASVFATTLAAVALSLLWFAVNPLTSVLTLFTVIGYAVVYTRYLKWIGPQNIVLGGAAGAAPALIGWSAVSGHLAWPALALFLIILVWTPPHFWALAIARRDEYARARVPMLPVTHGVAHTKRAILRYTLLLFPVSLLPWLEGISGGVYAVGAVLLGVGFILRAYRLQFLESDRAAMQVFAYSITYLTALFALMLVDHFMVF